MSRKKKKQIKKKVLTKEQRYAKNMDAVRFWSRRVSKDMITPSDNTFKEGEIPKVGIVTYKNKEKRYGYIFDEDGKSHRFYYIDVSNRKYLEWNKPVLFIVRESGKVKVWAVPALEIVRARGKSNNTYRTFGVSSRSKVRLRG